MSLIPWMILGLLFVGQGTQRLFGRFRREGHAPVMPVPAWSGPGLTAAAPVEPATTSSTGSTRAGSLTPAFLCAADALALCGALLATNSGRSAAGMVYVATAMVTIAASDGYRARITLSALRIAPWLAGRLAIPLVVVTPIAFVTGAPAAVFTLPVAGMVCVIASRAAAYSAIRRARRAGHLLENAVIIGAGEVGTELARLFAEHPEHGVRPVGFLDQVDDDLPLPLLGDVDRLDALLEQGDIQRVVVAFGPSREADLVNLLRIAMRHDVELHVVPRFFDIGVTPAGPASDEVRGIPMHRVTLPVKYAGVKRVVDVAVAGALLTVTAPVLGLVALLVKTTSRGPVFFSQERVGRGGRVFRMHKFRTMVDGADRQRDRLNHLNERDGAVFKIRDDPRCTRVGRVLRRFSLDELPQLWNVLRGDMTLVGPRPAVPAEVARYDDDARWRLLVKPGLTGLWQISGRSDLAWSESLRLDLYYVYHWTPSLDLAILGSTLGAVVRHRGAY